MTTPQDRIKAALSSLAGIEIPGGCMDCDAYQVVTVLDGGHSIINIRHDDTCPTFRAMGGGDR
jgi:hypothetical protein